MKNLLLSFFCLCFIALNFVSARKENVPGDEELLKLYQGLRVADVSDGMDYVGLPNTGLMGTEIESLWKDIENFGHQFCGIAVTARYVPSNRPSPAGGLSPEEFREWSREWLTELSPETFTGYMKPGTVLVMDCRGDGDTGSAGSFNSMIWKKKGMAGLVSNGGVRDTDEIIKERIPVYMDLANRGRGVRQGRNELESVNRPVVVGGVLVRPGDVVVADGDGVIVVPREKAVQVAEYAHDVLKKDKAGRRRLYESLGIPLDFTVED